MQLPTQWQKHDVSIRPYRMAHRIVTWAFRIIAVIIFGLAWERGWIHQLHVTTSQIMDPNGFIQSLLFFFFLGIVAQLLLLPFQYIHYRIERHYQLSRQGLLSWLGDKAKGLALGTLFGAIALSTLYYCYTQLGTWWWIAVAGIFIFFSVVLAQLAPVLLIPLFYKLKPLEASHLKTRLFDLCRIHQVHVAEIYHLGLGEKTEKGNAAFVGLGKTKRIIIGDTLYKKFTPEQVEAVFAHELGHQVHGDMWKGIIFSAVGLVVGFGLTNKVISYLPAQLPELPQSIAITLLAFGVVFRILSMPLDLIQLGYCRSRERLADRFAAETVRVSESLAAALERLTFQNKTPFKPNVFIEFFTYSHPAPWRRIMKLRANSRVH